MKNKVSPLKLDAEPFANELKKADKNAKRKPMDLDKCHHIILENEPGECTVYLKDKSKEKTVRERFAKRNTFDAIRG